jgi:hypothetical protein
MFAKAMSFATRKPAETVENKMDTGKSLNGDSTTTRRQFGRDITNSTVNDSVSDKNSFKPTFLAPPPAVTARAEDIMIDGMSSAYDDRSYMERPSDDIDARDVDNPLLCTDYVNQMYDNFAVMEKEYALSPDYMSKQSFINEKMRAILCDWLVSIRKCSAIHVYLRACIVLLVLYDRCDSYSCRCPRIAIAHSFLTNPPAR